MHFRFILTFLLSFSAISSSYAMEKDDDGLNAKSTPTVKYKDNNAKKAAFEDFSIGSIGNDNIKEILSLLTIYELARLRSLSRSFKEVCDELIPTYEISQNDLRPKAASICEKYLTTEEMIRPSFIPALTWVSLSNWSFIDIPTNMVVPMGLLFKKLQGTKIHTLGMYSFFKFGNEGAVELAKNLQGTNIHTIELNGVAVDVLIGLVKNLQGTKVKKFYLRANDMGNEGANEFAKNLGTNVQVLDLTSNYIGTAGAIGLGKNLHNTNVHTLNLSGNNIGDEGAIGLAQNLQGTNVQVLVLHTTGISIEGAIKLAENLENTNVHTVNLYVSSYGPPEHNEGLKNLCENQLQQKYPHIKWVFNIGKLGTAGFNVSSQYKKIKIF